MNKSINLLVLGLLTLGFSSCEDYKGQIVKQQTTNDSLQAANEELVNIKISLELKVSELEDDIYTIRKKYEKSSTGNQQAAIAAIKYQLKMYHPDVRYSDIRAVSKSDGSIDIILDIIDHFNSNKYYNVTTYSDGSYRINKQWGAVF